MNPILISSLIAAAITGSGVGYQLQAGRISTLKLEIKDEQLSRANERIAIQRAARSALERTTNQVAKAQTDAAVRTAALAAVVERTRTELDSLRIASEAAVRNADSGIEACTRSVHTYHQLFLGCSEQLVDVAQSADRWSIQAVTLQDAWPK